MASCTSWPLSGFLSSAVKMGTPFRKRARSRLWSVCSLKRSWRTTANRLAACRRCDSSLSPLAGRKYASRNLQPESLTPLRSTSRAPRRVNLAGEAGEEAGPHVGPVVLLELLPLLGLGGEEEVDDPGGDEAERAVVVLRPPPVVAAGRRVVAERRGRLSHCGHVARAGVGAVGAAARVRWRPRRRVRKCQESWDGDARSCPPTCSARLQDRETEINGVQMLV